MNRLQQGGALLLPFWRSIQKKTFKRPLCVLSVCLQGILFCGPLEADPLMPRDVRLECKDCGQMGAVILKDDGGRSIAAGSETQNSVGESSAENGGGGGEARFMSVSPSEVRADASKDQKSKEVFDSHLFTLIGFVLAVLLPMYVSATTNDNRLTTS